MGLPVPGPTSPDYIVLDVMNSLLGGSFASRITTNIREQKGYTYSPFSQIGTRHHLAFWLQVADVTTNVTGPSLKEIFYEIDRLRKEPPPEGELKGIQNYLAGLFYSEKHHQSRRRHRPIAFRGFTGHGAVRSFPPTCRK